MSNTTDIQPVACEPNNSLPMMGRFVSPDTTSSRRASKGPARSWSLGMLEDYIKQDPALPNLLASASRARTKQKMHAQRAAIRAALVNTKKSARESRPVFARQAPKPGHSSSSSQQASGAHPFASGPLAIVDDPQGGASPGGTSIRHSISQERDKQTTYLIRTDLRYSSTDDTVVALMELPGLHLEDVQLKLGSRSSGIRHLIVTASSRPPPRVSGELAMQERLYGVFTRTLIVPPHITASDIEAEMRNGILMLKIPGTKFEDVAIKQTKRESEG